MPFIIHYTFYMFFNDNQLQTMHIFHISLHLSIKQNLEDPTSEGPPGNT